jgi:hypothetical protein
MSVEQNNQFENNEGSFGLPNDYFKKSAGSIMNKIEWEEEHKAYPSLRQLKSSSPFIVPDNYFALNETLLELTGFPVLKTIAKTNAFKIPDAYFESAEVKELAGVMLDETNELATFEKLGAIKKQNCFKVDEAYFDVNEKLLITLLKPEKSARIVDLFFLRRSYVAAAMLLTALGLWLYAIYLRPVQKLKDCGTIACVDRMDLMKNKNLESLDNEELYELIDAGELEKKLEKKNSSSSTNKQQDSSLNNLTVDELMDEI